MVDKVITCQDYASTDLPDQYYIEGHHAFWLGSIGIACGDNVTVEFSDGVRKTGKLRADTEDDLYIDFGNINVSDHQRLLMHIRVSATADELCQIVDAALERKADILSDSHPELSIVLKALTSLNRIHRPEVFRDGGGD